MHLLNDLYTIYGELLIKGGLEITPTAVKKIRRMGERHKQVRVPLKNTDIFTDFERVFDDERYLTILKAPVSKNQICGIAGRFMIENDLMFELSNMKNNLPYTYYHVLVVAALVIKLSLLYGPKDYDMEDVAHCGFTHDIGKTRIPIKILNKKEPLTKEERAIIETHPAAGYLLLNYYLKQDRRDCSLASLEHHERLDGSGYPIGAKKIHKYTKLISPADVLDALMTKRPYRTNTFTLRAALDYLVKEANMNKLDKDVVFTLIAAARKDKPSAYTLQISKEVREDLPEELTHDKYG